LWAWYGRDFASVNQLLADPKAELTERWPSSRRCRCSSPSAARRPARRHHRPPQHPDRQLYPPARRRPAHPADLREAALKATIHSAPGAARRGVFFVERKAVNDIRGTLSDLLGVENLYSLDRYDLTVHTTLDGPSQQAVTRVLNRLADPAFLACAGLKKPGCWPAATPSRSITA
jgi:hypothetical protein